MPSPSSWGNSDDDKLAVINNTTYYASNYEEFYNAINYKEGWKYYNKFNKITDNLDAPGVPTYAMYSVGVDTAKYYVWNTVDVTKTPNSVVRWKRESKNPECMINIHIYLYILIYHFRLMVMEMGQYQNNH